MSQVSPTNEGDQDAEELAKKHIHFTRTLISLIQNKFQMQVLSGSPTPVIIFLPSAMRGTEFNLFIICVEEPKISPFLSMPL